jgi:hypothetical protein
MDMLVEHCDHVFYYHVCHRRTMFAMLKYYPKKLSKETIRHAFDIYSRRSDVKMIYNMLKIYVPIYSYERKFYHRIIPKIFDYIERDKMMRKILPDYLISDLLDHIIYKYAAFIQFSDSNKPTRSFTDSGQLIYHEHEGNIKRSLKEIDVDW